MTREGSIELLSGMALRRIFHMQWKPDPVKGPGNFSDTEG
jgi:hypothetical protein